MHILSLNTSLLTALGGEIQIKDRVHRRSIQIATKILTLPEKPDIVCLQEAFDHEAVMNIVEILENDYPYYYIDTNCPAFVVGVDSGLAIFSKYKINKTLLRTYPVSKGDSFFSNKGVMAVKVTIPELENKEVCIFNTHMQAGGNNKWYLRPLDLITTTWTTDQIRYSQLKFAYDRIEQFCKDIPTIFAGDFNIDVYSTNSFTDPKTKEVIAVNQMINHIFPDSDTFDININGQKYSIYEDKKIDYILGIGIKGKSWIIDNFIPADTDHRGMIGEF